MEVFFRGRFVGRQLWWLIVRFLQRGDVMARIYVLCLPVPVTTVTPLLRRRDVDLDVDGMRDETVET